MPKRFNPSQYRSKLRQLQSKQRQAISRYNQGVRKYNQSVRDLKRAVDRYNQEVRTYNSRQRLHRQRLQTELSRLRQQSSSRNASFRASVNQLQTVYSRLEQTAEGRVLSPSENYFLDLAEREAANSAEVANALESQDSTGDSSSLQQTIIADEIAVISEDLDARWQGALFSLNPKNPDAARHFCSSSREIFTEILEARAPDASVFTVFPDAQRTEKGNATRRAKMHFLLHKKGVDLAELAEFASEDIGNVLELFDVLNTGTHGPAGRYDMGSLLSIKRRVEDGLLFLSRVAV